MKILVDGDSCPVLDIIENFCQDNNITLQVYFDLNHDITLNYGEAIRVDQGQDNVDLILLEETEPGDLIVTQDYGLASLALGKGAYAINEDGLIYTEENIDALLAQRHIQAQKRRAKSGPRQALTRQRQQERTWRDDIDFHHALTRMVRKIQN